MANLEISGKIHEKYDTVQVSDTFQKREFVLEINESAPNGMVYTNYASFQLVQANVSLLDKYHAGDEVKVSFGIRGNKWERKDGEVRYITNLNAWKIDPLNVNDSEQGQAKGQSTNSETTTTTNTGTTPNVSPISDDNSDDDLPF